jgi:hypothetical protein
MKERIVPDIGDSRRFLDEMASGDLRRALEALRDRLAVELDQTSGHGVASLARVLLDVLRDIGKLPVPSSERSFAEELDERRRARLEGMTTARGETRVKRYGGRERETKPRTRFPSKGS